MTLEETIASRQSVRAYQDRPIEEEQLISVLAAANRAPSAGNLQAYEILIVRDADRKNRLVGAALNQEFLAQAPVVLVFCAHPARCAKYGERGRRLYCIQDAAAAVSYAQLAATALGLATCWVGAFDDEKVARILDLPPDLQPVAMLPLGYAAETPQRAARRLLADLVRDLPTLL